MTAFLLRDFLPAIGRWGRGEIEALARLEFLPESMRAGFAFAVRNCAATGLALWIAFYLELDEPYWAGMAVWMVAQPTPGMAMSKAYYRIVGTIIGAFVGLILIAFFAQVPELFILALSLWVGLCTVGSNLLRNFRAYATVLAGYTAAIVSLGTYQSPDNVFYVATARACSTIIGIACAALITELFTKHEARGKVMVKLRQVIGAAGQRCSLAPTDPLEARLAVGKPLTANLIALDAEIEFAAAESAAFRIHADGARSLLAHLFGAYSAKRALDAHLLRTLDDPRDPQTEAVLKDAIQLIGTISSMMESGKGHLLSTEISALQGRLGSLDPESSGQELTRMVSSRFIIDRLHDMLGHLGMAILDWGRIQGGWRWQPSLRLNFHQDQRLAWIHGARATLALLAAGFFWVETAWSSGASMLILASVACSLFSAAPQPDKAGMAFLEGTLVASFAAFACNFYFLANVSGFPLMVLIYVAFLMPGAIAFMNPKVSLAGLAYCVNFLGTSRPLNLMNYDIVSFINNAVASVIALCFSVLAYQLFMPPDPPAARRYVVYRIRLGIERISQWTPIPKACDWQTRMFDRINRLHNPDNPSGSSTDEWFDGGLGAMNLGNEVLRLRHLLEEGQLSEPVAHMVRTTLKSFGELVEDPSSAELIVRSVRDALEQAEPEGNIEQKRAWVRTLGVLEEMDSFFVDHPGFLRP